MAVTLKLRQGTKAAIPTTGMVLGEPLYCTDTTELYVATATDAKAPITIDVSSFDALGAVASGDLIYMYDVSVAAAGIKAKKITFDDFKTALNIPTASTDEKVACASGATAGYLGTAGSDGVLRAGTGIAMTAGGSNAYTTLSLYFASEAQGDIIYRGASAWGRLAVGAAGTLLQAGGAGTNPTWISTIDGGTF
jgi:hypothetical protein